MIEISRTTALEIWPHPDESWEQSFWRYFGHREQIKREMKILERISSFETDMQKYVLE